MAEIYFTIAVTNHHHGQDFLEPKMKVKLVKEPDNEYDKEAIKVEMPGIGHFQLHTFLSPVIKPEREETMNKEINSVGARIRVCRKEMGYSQETLAAMLYMKKTTICKYEKDLHDIPSSVLVELAKALHTTPNYLLLGDVEADDWMDDMIQMLLINHNLF